MIGGGLSSLVRFLLVSVALVVSLICFCIVGYLFVCLVLGPACSSSCCVSSVVSITSGALGVNCVNLFFNVTGGFVIFSKCPIFVFFVIGRERSSVLPR